MTMATRVKQSIGEIDVVAFTEAIDKVDGTGKWPAGTEGTVVSDYGDHKEVEISDDRGVALDFPVVPVGKLKLIEKHS
jgi:DNA polymerase/3'-5' exonuclease PolX